MPGFRLFLTNLNCTKPVSNFRREQTHEKSFDISIPSFSQTMAENENPSRMMVLSLMILGVGMLAIPELSLAGSSNLPFEKEQACEQGANGLVTCWANHVLNQKTNNVGWSDLESPVGFHLPRHATTFASRHPRLRTHINRHQQCRLSYNLPADVQVDLPSFSPQEYQSTFDRLSWQTFLALNAPKVNGQVSRYGDNQTQWERWSSTTDLIECQENPEMCICPNEDCTQSGSRNYPAECQSIPGYQRYRVIQEIGKVDDSIVEANVGGLSDFPVIDNSGRFLRYEIRLSPVVYDFVIANRLYDDKVLEAADRSHTIPLRRRHLPRWESG